MVGGQGERWATYQSWLSCCAPQVALGFTTRGAPQPPGARPSAAGGGPAAPEGRTPLGAELSAICPTRPGVEGEEEEEPATGVVQAGW